MKKISLFIIAAVFAVSTTACGGNSAETTAQSGGDGAKALTYKDGEYSGESSVDDYGGKITVKITEKDVKIDELTVQNLDKEGKEKDENYGKDAGQEGLYNKAQESVKNTKLYPQKLKEAQNIDGVDSISGATKSYASFKEAVNAALKDAQ